MDKENQDKYYYQTCSYINYQEERKLQQIYPTLWQGFLKYKGDKIEIKEEYKFHQKSNTILDDILVDITDTNFYVNLKNDYIYLSLDSDSYYYYYNFEKQIKKLIKKIEKEFKIYVTEGEFFATEIKHLGNQYCYEITRKENNKIFLVKKVLNWEIYAKKINHE